MLTKFTFEGRARRVQLLTDSSNKFGELTNSFQFKDKPQAFLLESADCQIDEFLDEEESKYS